MNRLESVDALRGIAVLLVILVHGAQIADISNFPEPLKNLISAGKSGVQLFYIISAFTLFYSLSQRHEPTSAYFIRRFFRIAPLYWIAIAYYVWVLNNENWTSIFLNVFFLHGFSPAAINTVVPGGWSIGVEMTFYLFVPFLFRRLTSLNLALKAFNWSLLISFAILYLLRKLNPAVDSSRMESFLYFFLGNQLPIFSLGFVVFRFLFPAEKEEPVSKGVWVAFGLILLLSTATELPVFRNHILISFSFLILFVALFSNPVKFVVNKMTIYIGKISYSVYLTQYAALFIINDLFGDFFQADQGNLIGMGKYGLAILMLALFSIGISSVTYRLIEEPGQNIGKWLIRRYVRKVPG